jgi:peroxiredoxin
MLSSVVSFKGNQAVSRVAFAFASVFGVLLCGAGCARQELQVAQIPTTRSAIAAGLPAPDFSALDIDGNRVTLSQHRGSVVLLNFCSTWCEPCVAELPHLRSLYEANKDKGFIILAISVDGPETAANVAGFARRNGLDPMIIDGDSRIAMLYNPKKIAPVTVVIGRSGKIAVIHEGYTAGDEEELSTAVAKALDGPRASR